MLEDILLKAKELQDKRAEENAAIQKSIRVREHYIIDQVIEQLVPDGLMEIYMPSHSRCDYTENQAGVMLWFGSHHLTRVAPFGICADLRTSANGTVLEITKNYWFAGKWTLDDIGNDGIVPTITHRGAPKHATPAEALSVSLDNYDEVCRALERAQQPAPVPMILDEAKSHYRWAERNDEDAPNVQLAMAAALISIADTLSALYEERYG